MANLATRQTAINFVNEPANVATGAVPLLPTSIGEIGNTGIVNLSQSAPSAASKAAQVAPAIVLPTVDPMVKGAIYISNTVSGTISVSSQAT